MKAENQCRGFRQSELLVRNLRFGRLGGCCWRGGNVGRGSSGRRIGRRRRSGCIGGSGSPTRRRRRGGGSWHVRAAELVEYPTLALTGRRHPVEDIGRLRAVARDDGQAKRGGEEGDRQNRSSAGQRVGSAPRSHKAGTTADAKPTALGALQEHHANKRKHDHQMNDDDNGFHEFTRWS